MYDPRVFSARPVGFPGIHLLLKQTRESGIPRVWKECPWVSAISLRSKTLVGLEQRTACDPEGPGNFYTGWAGSQFRSLPTSSNTRSFLSGPAFC